MKLQYLGAGTSPANCPGVVVTAGVPRRVPGGGRKSGGMASRSRPAYRKHGHASARKSRAPRRRLQQRRLGRRSLTRPVTQGDLDLGPSMVPSRRLCAGVGGRSRPSATSAIVKPNWAAWCAGQPGQEPLPPRGPVGRRRSRTPWTTPRALEQIRPSAHAMPFPDELEGFHPRRTAVRHILVWLENSPPSLAPW